jgi:hypothetical protein
MELFRQVFTNVSMNLSLLPTSGLAKHVQASCAIFSLNVCAIPLPERIQKVTIRTLFMSAKRAEIPKKY